MESVPHTRVRYGRRTEVTNLPRVRYRVVQKLQTFPGFGIVWYRSYKPSPGSVSCCTEVTNLPQVGYDKAYPIPWYRYEVVIEVKNLPRVRYSVVQKLQTSPGFGILLKRSYKPSPGSV